jgi:tetratricopeptide (TPR) repeat protein
MDRISRILHFSCIIGLFIIPFFIISTIYRSARVNAAMIIVRDTLMVPVTRSEIRLEQARDLLVRKNKMGVPVDAFALLQVDAAAGKLELVRADLDYLFDPVQKQIGQYRLADLYLSSNQPWQALAILQEMHTPELVWKITGMGATFMTAEQWELAIAAFDLVATLDPGNVNAYHQISDSQAALGDFLAAIVAAKRAIVLSGDSVKLNDYMWVESIYENANRFDEAETWLLQAAGLYPESPDPLITLVRVAYKDGKNELALDTATHLLVSFPENDDVLVEVAKVYLAENVLDRAEQAARKAVKLNPANAEAQYQLGRVLAQLNNNTEAEVHLSNAVSLESNNPWYLASYAQLVQRHDPQLAIKLFTRALTLYTSDEDKADIKKQLEKLTAPPH